MCMRSTFCSNWGGSFEQRKVVARYASVPSHAHIATVRIRFCGQSENSSTNQESCIYALKIELLPIEMILLIYVCSESVQCQVTSSKQSQCQSACCSTQHYWSSMLVTLHGNHCSTVIIHCVDCKGTNRLQQLEWLESICSSFCTVYYNLVSVTISLGDNHYFPNRNLASWPWFSVHKSSIGIYNTQ